MRNGSMYGDTVSVGLCKSGAVFIAYLIGYKIMSPRGS